MPSRGTHHAPNNSFKPNPLRSGNGVAEKACHAVACTAQVGLTQALGGMSAIHRSGTIKGFLGAFLGCFGMIVVADRCISLLQLSGGSYGGYGIAIGILGVVAMAALALGMLFGRRWRNVRAESIGALLGTALSLSLSIASRVAT